MLCVWRKKANKNTQNLDMSIFFFFRPFFSPYRLFFLDILLVCVIGRAHEWKTIFKVSLSPEMIVITENSVYAIARR